MRLLGSKQTCELRDIGDEASCPDTDECEKHALNSAGQERFVKGWITFLCPPQHDAIHAVDCLHGREADRQKGTLE